MTDEGFTIRTKRWPGAVWAVVGLAFLCLAVDLKFLCWIPGASEEARSWLAFLILSAIGAGTVYPAVRALFRPRTLLAVSRDGITISAAGDRSEWNSKTNRMERVISYGEEQQIPWHLVERIEAGTIERFVESETQGTVISRSDLSTTRIGGQTIRRSHKRPALRILFSREVSMDLISVRDLIHARIGDALHELPLAELTHLSSEDIEDLTMSEFLIDARLLPAPVDRVIEVMQSQKRDAA